MEGFIRFEKKNNKLIAKFIMIGEIKNDKFSGYIYTYINEKDFKEGLIFENNFLNKSLFNFGVPVSEINDSDIIDIMRDSNNWELMAKKFKKLAGFSMLDINNFLDTTLNFSCEEMHYYPKSFDMVNLIEHSKDYSIKTSNFNIEPFSFAGYDPNIIIEKENKQKGFGR